MLLFLLGRGELVTDGGGIYLNNQYVALPRLNIVEAMLCEKFLKQVVMDQTLLLEAIKSQLSSVILTRNTVHAFLSDILVFPHTDPVWKSPRAQVLNLIQRNSPDGGINTPRFNRRETPKPFSTRVDIWEEASHLATALFTNIVI